MSSLVQVIEGLKRLSGGLLIPAGKKEFETFAKPALEALTPVVIDYSKVLQEFKIILKEAETSKDLDIVIDKFKDLNNNLRVERHRLRTQAAVLSVSIKDKNVADFFTKINNLFEPSLGDGRKMSRSRGTLIIDIVEQIAEGNLSKGETIRYIDVNIRHVEESWVAICQSYARMQVRYI